MRTISSSPTMSYISETVEERWDSTACRVGANSSWNMASSPKKSAQNRYSLVAVSISSLFTLRNSTSAGNFRRSASATWGMSAAASRCSRMLARSPTANTSARVPSPVDLPNSDSMPADGVSGAPTISLGPGPGSRSDSRVCWYARKCEESTRASVSTYAARTSLNTSGPWARRNDTKYRNRSSMFCCRIWMLVLGFRRL
mmetsp:Transcript_13713/g.41429  ORF Transcript_13713/g.41429 Transcript_13713/m.41429 type:complete len:200 (+) Transcript_13713:326-925(+)